MRVANAYAYESSVSSFIGSILWYSGLVRYDAYDVQAALTALDDWVKKLQGLHQAQEKEGAKIILDALRNILALLQKLADICAAYRHRLAS